MPKFSRSSIFHLHTQVKMKMISFTVFVVFFSSIQIASGTEQPTVTLKDGSVLQGVYEEFHSDSLPVHGKIESFYGIPYAEAPVGPLRFKPPVPKKPLESPFEATKVGRSCMQADPEIIGIPFANAELSEDCLFLDVIVPKSAPEKAHVFVSIHGGGFVMGAGQMPWDHFLTLASYGNVIVVAFNYRLGPFGFLTTDDNLLPGNLGLFDQQLVLKWVNENIEVFGGDPNKVTIQGVSAGGASVAFHILSPGSAGLFKYAIMESGSPFDSWVTFRQGEEARLEVRTLAKLIGCSEEDIEDDAKLLDCLMAAPAEDINENISKVSNMYSSLTYKPLVLRVQSVWVQEQYTSAGRATSFLNSDTNKVSLIKEIPRAKAVYILGEAVGQTLGDPFFPPPGPNVDGIFLPKDPIDIIKEGSLNGESYISGSNAEEGTGFLWMFHPDKENKPVINSTSFATAIASGFIGNVPPSIMIELIKTIYTVDENDLVDKNQDDYFHEASQFLGDLMFFCGESKFARLVSPLKDLYRFTMTYVPSNNLVDIKWAGASHGDQAQFVLGAPFQEKHVNKTTDEERDMSRKVMQYWINFMKTGDPNIAEDTDHMSLPNWPKFTKENQIYKDLTPDMENRYMKKRECYFMDNVFLPLKDTFKELRSLKTSDDEKSKWTKDGQCEGEACHVDEEKP